MLQILLKWFLNCYLWDFLLGVSKINATTISYATISVHIRLEFSQIILSPYILCLQIDNELEEQKLKKAFGDDTSYEDESEDFKKMLDIEAPVKLPMDDGGIVLIYLQ